MSTEQSIVVVDDAKFSAAIVTKRLNNAGFQDVRTAHHANAALDMIAERPCDLLVADWLMPDIDGVELCQAVRAFDRMQEHFTYCLLITAKEGNEALCSAFDQGLDDFILKSDLNAQLVPRVIAGLRLSQTINSSIEKRAHLEERIEFLGQLQARDSATGLGTRQHARDALTKTLRHTSSRGGATSYMSVQVLNWDQIAREYTPLVCEELAKQIARKLSALVRPMDEVCKLNDNDYAVVAHFADSNDCNLSTYRRIHQGLDKQAFKTSAGYIAVSVACAICFVDDDHEQVSLERLCDFNSAQLREWNHQKTLVVSPWKKTA